jgi:hypothetical protein
VLLLDGGERLLQWELVAYDEREREKENKTNKIKKYY